ncbi:hypothetical protein [Effusibacillus pohliae]|uniref:hypothetical protein n=1 Tax=Effusibacillus pohliae TaxID=232270 RepID=UPI00035EEC4B|nr:hypothetical protein [Effusibacillus pohliae]
MDRANSEAVPAVFRDRGHFRQKAGQTMAETGFVLTYKLADDTPVAAEFDSENDRDGCDMSLGMYQANLGPVTQDVWERYVARFNGRLLG